MWLHLKHPPIPPTLSLVRPSHVAVAWSVAFKVQHMFEIEIQQQSKRKAGKDNKLERMDICHVRIALKEVNQLKKWFQPSGCKEVSISGSKSRQHYPNGHQKGSRSQNFTTPVLSGGPAHASFHQTKTWHKQRKEKKPQINKNKQKKNKSTSQPSRAIHWLMDELMQPKFATITTTKQKKMNWNFERWQRGTADRWQRSHAKNPLKHPSPSADWTNSTINSTIRLNWSNQLIFLLFFCFCLEQSEASATTTWTTLTTTRNERCKMKK